MPRACGGSIADGRHVAVAGWSAWGERHAVDGLARHGMHLLYLVAGAGGADEPDPELPDGDGRTQDPLDALGRAHGPGAADTGGRDVDAGSPWGRHCIELLRRSEDRELAGVHLGLRVGEESDEIGFTQLACVPDVVRVEQDLQAVPSAHAVVHAASQRRKGLCVAGEVSRAVAALRYRQGAPDGADVGLVRGEVRPEDHVGRSAVVVDAGEIVRRQPGAGLHKRRDVEPLCSHLVGGDHRLVPVRGRVGGVRPMRPRVGHDLVACSLHGQQLLRRRMTIGVHRHVVYGEACVEPVFGQQREGQGVVAGRAVVKAQAEHPCAGKVRSLRPSGAGSLSGHRCTEQEYDGRDAEGDRRPQLGRRAETPGIGAAFRHESHQGRRRRPELLLSIMPHCPSGRDAPQDGPSDHDRPWFGIRSTLG